MTLEVIDGGAKTDIGFIDTPTSRLIRAAIMRVKTRREPGLIIGPPGIGKTQTIDAIQQEDHRCACFMVSPATKGVKAFLSGVADAFGMPSLCGHAAEIQHTLFYSRYPADFYLVVDEAQNLDLDTFRTALMLHDVAGVPVAFVGNPATLKRAGGRAAAFDQISDRLYYRQQISGIVSDDVKAFGMAYGVEGDAAYDFIVRFGLSTSSLRQLAGLLREARLVAGPKGPIRLGHLRDSLILLRGEDAAKKYLKPRLKHASSLHQQDFAG